MFEVLIVFTWFAVGYGIRKLCRMDDSFVRAQSDKGAVLFSEDFVSGRNLRGFPFGPFGGAWALSVVVAKDQLWIWPMAAFRPTFIAYLMGLETVSSLDQVIVQSVGNASFGRKAIHIRLERESSTPSKIVLYVKSADRLLHTLAESSSIGH